MVAIFLLGLTESTSAQERWRTRATPARWLLNAITCGNGRFVAVGAGGTILHSADGETWTLAESGTTETLRSVAVGINRFVAGRANVASPLLTSPDGVNWSPATLTDASGRPAQAACYAAIEHHNGRWVATGASAGDLAVSDDGVNFRLVAAGGATPYPGGITAMRGLGGRFFGIQGNGRVYSTVDGQAWELKFASSDSSDFLSRLATDGLNRIVIVGAGRAVISTDRGATFRSVTRTGSDGSPTPGIFSALTYGAGLFVAHGEMERSPADRATVWISTDGVAWRRYFPLSYGSSPYGQQASAYHPAGIFAAIGAIGGTMDTFAPVVTSSARVSPIQEYTVRSPGLLSGTQSAGWAINQAGDLLATSADAAGGTSVFLHRRDGSVTALGVAGVSQTAMALNDAGEAVGRWRNPATGVFVPARFSPAGVTSLLPDRPEPGTAVGINSAGTIVGYLITTAPNGGTKFVYFSGREGAFSYYEDKSIGAINDRGDFLLLGGARPAGILLSSGAFTELTTPYPSIGIIQLRALSATDVAAGACTAPVNAASSQTTQRSFVWVNGAPGQEIDSFETNTSIPTAINGRMDVVGTYSYPPESSFLPFPYLYTRGALRDLNSLRAASAQSWLLESAVAINDAGEIAGTGTLNGAHQAFVAAPVPRATRLINLSTRLRAEGGDAVPIVGFVIRGGAKKVAVRALGPSLSAAGVPNLLPDPSFGIYNAAGAVMDVCQNWTDAGLPARLLQEAGLAPSAAAEAASVYSLAEGSYTVIMRGAGAATAGNCLVEVYDLEPEAPATLVNVSTRGRVGAGDDVMIAGFVIGGTEPRRVLVRALGPSLATARVPDVLADPSIELLRGGASLASNQDWRNGPDAAAAQAAGLAPTNEREAVIVQTLPPGAFTAIVRGTGGGTGNAIVEVYDVP